MLRNEIPWLCAYSFSITRYVLKYQADAWKAFFRGEAGHPRFKSRHGSTQSFTIPEAVTVRDDMISIPRVGPIRIRRNPEGKPVKAVNRKIAGKWSITVCYEVEAEERSDTGVLAGVDMNVRQVAVVDTTGGAEIIPAPGTGRLDAKIGRNQRRLARQRKGSRRRMRTRLRLQRLLRMRASRRKNWHHQVEPPDREPGEQGFCREAQHGGDDAIGPGHAREPRHEGEGQVRSQPGDPEHRPAWHEGEARLQVLTGTFLLAL